MIRTILLVDDSADFRFMARLFLMQFGYVVDLAHCVEDALDLFEPLLHDLVITDNSMPGMTGSEMAHIIKLRSPATPVLMISGLPPSDLSCVDLFIQKGRAAVALKGRELFCSSASWRKVRSWSWTKRGRSADGKCSNCCAWLVIGTRG